MKDLILQDSVISILFGHEKYKKTLEEVGLKILETAQEGKTWVDIENLEKDVLNVLLFFLEKEGIDNISIFNKGKNIRIYLIPHFN